MSDRPALTDKQQRIFNFIRKHIETKGFPPAIRDICDAFKIKSPNGVMCHLKALQNKGYIERVQKHDNQRAQARGITIPGVSAGGFSLPLLGVVAAEALLARPAQVELGAVVVGVRSGGDVHHRMGAVDQA